MLRTIQWMALWSGAAILAGCGSPSAPEAGEHEVAETEAVADEAPQADEGPAGATTAPAETVDEGTPDTPAVAHGPDTTEPEAQPATAPKVVLLAVKESAFKTEIARLVSKALAADGNKVDQVKPEDVTPDTPKAYDAVILIDAVASGGLSKAGMKIIEAMADTKEKLYVLATAGEADWKLKTPGVDAITSASKMPQAQAIGDKVVAKARAILGTE